MSEDREYDDEYEDEEGYEEEFEEEMEEERSQELEENTLNTVSSEMQSARVSVNQVSGMGTTEEPNESTVFGLNES